MAVTPRLLVALVLAAAAGTACAGATEGAGRQVAGATASVDDDTAAPVPTTASPPDPTTETAAPTTTSEPAPSTTVSRTELACPPPAVMPAGAPYCYTRPQLEPIDLGDPTAGEEGSFRTSFGFGPADHIDVQAYVVGVDTDGLSAEEIITELSGVVADLEDGGFDFADTPELITVDGARGFVYAGSSDDGTQDITAHFVFRGVNEVQLNCASTERPAVVADACAATLATLQVTS